MFLTFFSQFFLYSPVPFAFVVLKETATENHQAVVDELRRLVATKIAKYAVPEHFLVNQVNRFCHSLFIAITAFEVDY